MTPVCVDPDLIDQFWPHVKSLIEMAYWSGRGDAGADAVYQDLKARRALLWIVWDDDQKTIACATVTQLFSFERGKTCIIVACAGNQMDRWLCLLSVLEKYAKDEDCKYIRFSGRRGWIFHFQCLGWREPWVTLEKEL